MTVPGFFKLAINTVTAPRDVARLLLAMNLPKQALWLAFALVVVLNTLMFSLSLLTTPSNDLIGPVLGSPMVFGVMLAVSVAALIFAVTLCGRPLGGRATYAQIAVLVIWLQALRAVMQAAVVLIGPASLFLSGVVISAASVLGIWIFVNFIDVAHEMGSLLKAGLILLLAVVGMMLGLSMIFSLLGVQTGGLPGYV
ncbi:YIP1 family protein [Marivita hallyeonensis]|uniref:Yip1 domain-containing protein n=1 Tax=Marivita hallyeonensis TaxID=996342 RepID=A0A1M5VP05_9RHOB|nr:YIP1 family protein [Marivita hallyeonensis]SHH76979.1 Yip1 domain-containing protein [Marivita hallyeonensis]